MHSYLVAVVDGTQARFFTLDAGVPEKTESGPRLAEHSSLNNIEKPIATKGTLNNLIGRKHHGNRHEKTTQFAEPNRRFANKGLHQIIKIPLSFAGQHLILVP